MYFLEKYTSNEAQTKITTPFKAYKTFLSLFKKSQKWFKPKEAFQGLKKLFEENLVIRPAIIGIWLFARADIPHVFSRGIYAE